MRLVLNSVNNNLDAIYDLRNRVGAVIFISAKVTMEGEQKINP